MKKLILGIAALTAISTSAHASSYNEYCREFTQKIIVNGRTQTGYGTSCLRPNGDWEIVREAEIEEPQTIVRYEPVYIERPHPRNYNNVAFYWGWDDGWNRRDHKHYRKEHRWNKHYRDHDRNRDNNHDRGHRR